MCLLGRIICLPPRATSPHGVPPQQKVTPPLVDLSLAFPPETPRGELAPCPCCCGGKILISTESIALGSACEVAVITTSVVRPLLFPLFRTGTELGALYSPVVETDPVCGLPPITPFTRPVTAVLAFPVTVAMNWMDPNVMTSPEPGEIATLVLGPASSVTVAVP